MDIFGRDSSGSQSSTPELRLILVGNMGCGKSLTTDTLLNDSSSISALMPSRLSEVRRGVSEGWHLNVVETPRWYWKGEHIESSVQTETEKAISLVTPGPHAFLILVPVGQFTEMEGRIPTELQRVFGKGALEHTLVLLTCGDYLAGRDHDRYVMMGESGLSAMVNECGGRWHVINNRRPEDRKQVVSLLEKVEQLTKMSGGCYLPSPMQRQIEEGMHEKERELTRSYSLSQEELVYQDHSTLSQTSWSKEDTWDESGKRKIRVRSMGPSTGRVRSQQLANGLHSQTWHDDTHDDTSAELRQKHSSFKLSKEGAILSQMSEAEQPDTNLNNQNFINTIHYHISTMGDTNSAPTSIPSPSASHSPSFKTYSSSSYSSAAVEPSSSTNFSSYSSTLPSSPTKALSSSFSTGLSSSPNNATSSSTYFSSYSSSTLPSSPNKALSSSFSTDLSSSPTNTTSSSSSTSFSSSSALSSLSSYTNTSFSPSYNALSASSSTCIASTPTSSSFSSSSAFSAASPNTKASVFSPTTEVSSSFSSTNASSLSSSTALSPLSTTASSFFSSDSSDELRLVLLGRTGSGKSAAGNAILGRDEFKLRRDDATGATTHSCVKGTAMIGKKRVTVVDNPDWFWPPENIATHLSSCMDLCAPGPHVFLLCVPVTLPGRSNLHDLSSLKNSFGPDDIQHRTLVLFTHSDKLKDGNVEEYIAAKRPELLELVEKCEDHFHVLKQGRNEGNIGELLEKVEQAVKESGGNHYSCQGEVGRERMTQLRRGRGGEEDVDRANSATLHSLREEEEVEQEEKNSSILKSTASSVASVLSTVLRFVGQKVGEGAQQVPKPVAGGALLGGVLGLYFGGPIGGVVGATTASAAAEYGRRKYSKPKTD